MATDAKLTQHSTSSLYDLTACAFLSLSIYAIITVQMTVWRKKFRQKKNKHDDRFHTLANDALTNYETVKYFANEEYEIERYSEAVRDFQTFDVSVRGSLSLLNSSQQLIIQACMCFSLLIASGAILGNGGELKIGDFLAINVCKSWGRFVPTSALGCNALWFLSSPPLTHHPTTHACVENENQTQKRKKTNRRDPALSAAQLSRHDLRDDHSGDR